MITLLSVFFSRLILTSFLAGILVCVILLLKAILRSKVSVRWHYAIWFLFIGRLMLPDTLESAFSISHILDFITFHLLGYNKGINRVSNEISYGNTDLWSFPKEYVLSVDGYLRQPANHLFMYLWLIGVILCALV